jgi:hypothetical protein
VKLTVLYANSVFHVHKRGCADIPREARKANGPQMDIEHDTKEAVIRDLWIDFVQPGETDLGAYEAETHFAPCVKGLSDRMDNSTLNVVCQSGTGTHGPVLEWLGADDRRVWLRQEDGAAFSVPMATFQRLYCAYPIPEPAPAPQAPKSDTDWEAYDTCGTCMVDARMMCRGLTPRRGEEGLGLSGQRPLRRPHKGRPKLSR